MATTVSRAKEKEGKPKRIFETTDTPEQTLEEGIWGKYLASDSTAGERQTFIESGAEGSEAVRRLQQVFFDKWYGESYTGERGEAISVPTISQASKDAQIAESKSEVTGQVMGRQRAAAADFESQVGSFASDKDTGKFRNKPKDRATLLGMINDPIGQRKTLIGS